MIAGQTLSSNMNPAFEAAYPDVEVRMAWDQDNSANQLLDMTTKQAGADIYVLQVGSGLVDAMKKKGLALDLSQSEVLAAFSARMVPYIRDKVFDGDRCIAIPYRITTRQLYAYNSAAGEALGIEQPGSLSELAEIFAAWPWREETGGYTLYNSGISAVMSRFLECGINMYIAQNAQGDDVSFDTEEFRAYVSLLERLRDSFSLIGEEHSGWREHIQDHSLFLEFYPLLRTQEDIRINFPEAQPFAMSLSKGGSPLVPADMYVLIVSAASEKQSLALRYLECLAENYPPHQRILIDDSFRSPVEQAWYQEDISYYRQQKEDVEKLLADPANQDDALALQEQLKTLEYSLEELESMRWLITPEDIAGYEKIKPYIKMMPKISYDYYDAIPATKHLFFDFVNGEISADSFVDQLSQVQRLINLENE